MKKIVLISLLTIFSFSMLQAQNTSPQNMLRHVVMFGWKNDTDTADIKKVVDAFRALPGKISLIKALEWGTNNSPENLNQGLTHCFFLSFESEKDRDAYLPHPAHKEFGALLRPYLDKVVVVDYWVKE